VGPRCGGASKDAAVKGGAWFADNRAAVEAFRLNIADPNIPALIGFGRDPAGADISHAVALARGEVALEDLQAALAKAALAKGWSERR
jgi:hypothetical protein